MLSIRIFTELIPLRKHVTRLHHYTSVGGSEKPFFLSLSPFVRNKTALFDVYDLRWHHVLLSSPLLLTTSKNNLMTQNNRPKFALAVLQPIARWMARENTLVFRERGGTNRGRLGQTSGIEQPREM